ncbi:MAG: BTAD domain-containing putative transcriptional regulator [Proteobacteria bacterium]|nr:BTAD domain-containing putative transcriptional regulator [Pseudomonadota bacterium]
MSSLYVKLLGGFEICDGSGAPVGPLRRQAQAVLAVLALNPGVALSRDTLAALFWSERGDSQARGGLRSVLSDLRKAFADFDPPPLIADRETVRIDSTAVEVDAVTFARLIDDGTLESLERAAALYQGEFLDGLGVQDAVFEEWVRDERARLHDCARAAVSRLLEHRMAAGETDDALATAKRLLGLDPTHEGAHRALMRIYTDTDDRALALKQYRTCCEVLRTELGIEPDAATQQLHEDIRRTPMPGAPAEQPHEEGGHEPPALPDKPSIAVLPFVNMSGDAEQEYFSDGITEDIITELSRFSVLEVIARSSTFVFRDQAIDVSKAGKALGARYLLEGSLRKAGNRIRLTVQLIDVETSKHVWADRYDRELEDVFAIQDELVHAIVATLAGRVVMAETERSLRKPAKNWATYDHYLQALQISRRFDLENVLEGRMAVEKAVSLDPGFARAHALLAIFTIISGWLEGRACDEKALAIARKAVELDPDDANCYATLGFVHLQLKEFDQARHYLDQAVALNPHDLKIWSTYAWYLIAIGEHQLALDRLSEMAAFEPFPPIWLWEHCGLALYGLGRYEEAASNLARMTTLNPWDHAYLAACYGQLGEADKAQEHIESYRNSVPEASLQAFAESENFFQKFEDFEPWLDGLRKAGLPD